MAKITMVDYEAMPGQAQEMRTYGQELNAELKTAYTSVQEMHNNWYGVRYNALVKEFNELIPQLNEMLELVVGQIPFAIETIANNYAQADKGAKVAGASQTAPEAITDVPTTSDVGMRYLSAEVEATRSSISTNFKNATDKMNTIESAYGKIQWQSEASETFKAKFTELKGKIVEAFNNIESQFVTLMKQTEEDINATESANTVQ